MPDGPSSHANEVCVPGLYHLKGAVVIFSWHEMAYVGGVGHIMRVRSDIT